jgi:hypothetical protein
MAAAEPAPLEPTAKHSDAEAQETAVRTFCLAEAPSGLGTTAQVLPSQDSTRVSTTAGAVLLASSVTARSPTAKQAVAEAHAMPSSTLFPVPANSGVLSTDHDRPSPTSTSARL